MKYQPADAAARPTHAVLTSLMGRDVQPLEPVNEAPAGRRRHQRRGSIVTIEQTSFNDGLADADDWGE